MGISIKEFAPTAMVDTSSLHTPVFLERTIELLSPAIAHDGAVVVDATLGMGGHAEALLTRFPNITLVGLDRDTEALRLAGSVSLPSAIEYTWSTLFTTRSGRPSVASGSPRSPASV